MKDIFFAAALYFGIVAIAGFLLVKFGDRPEPDASERACCTDCPCQK